MNRTQLADAMIKGVETPGVVESRMHYITAASKQKLCKACALACALIGLFDGDFLEAERVYDEKAMNIREDEHIFSIFAGLLKIPESLAIEVEHKHLNGKTIEEIAAWLKSTPDEKKSKASRRELAGA